MNIVSERDYCDWVMKLEDPGAFREFIERPGGDQRDPPFSKPPLDPTSTTPFPRYMEKKPPAKCEDPPKKKQRTEDNTCKICCNLPINTVLVPCGHLVACFSCAQLLEDSCPICRQGVALVQKTYRA